MQKRGKFADVFTILTDFPLNTDTLDLLEKFKCHLYGHLKQNDIHEFIKLHFEEKCKPDYIERPLGNIKSVEPATFSSCRGVLTQHIKWVWYIAKLHKPASGGYPMNELTPVDYGWKLLEGSNLVSV